MEELIKILNIKKINFLRLDYTDNDGNRKKVEIDYSEECCCDANVAEGDI